MYKKPFRTDNGIFGMVYTRRDNVRTLKKCMKKRQNLVIRYCYDKLSESQMCWAGIDR